MSALSVIAVTVVLCWNAYRLSSLNFFLGDEEWPLADELSLNVHFGEPVSMRIDQSAHYKPDNSDSSASEEFARLIPPAPGGHTVRIPRPGSEPHKKEGETQTYTVTLFHQLKCLGIIRDNYASSVQLPAGVQEPLTGLTRHCMNYLRQSVLCHPDMGLESVVNARGTAERGYDAVCRDWTRLYEEVERNHGLYY
ncbi:hypothetical protein BJ138DRAFT_1115028 [Hygrophoropsis aurantiaca]|uniref:Uncharacterized protein n=1 Tax=Hygrophoropsis aurantiaca TaxID=72124 RepID=A0ACB8A8I8_9AGAM|nr:hypothetical protein BJ138DRAFT_1115028 [Hygrophoropsis aurantiaca]